MDAFEVVEEGADTDFESVKSQSDENYSYLEHGLA
jgi:hypothetical protein